MQDREVGDAVRQKRLVDREAHEAIAIKRSKHYAAGVKQRLPRVDVVLHGVRSGLSPARSMNVNVDQLQDSAPGLVLLRDVLGPVDLGDATQLGNCHSTYHPHRAAQRSWRSAAAMGGSEATDHAVSCNAGLGSGRQPLAEENHRRWCPAQRSVEHLGVSPDICDDHCAAPLGHSPFDFGEKPSTDPSPLQTGCDDELAQVRPEAKIVRADEPVQEGTVLMDKRYRVGRAHGALEDIRSPRLVPETVDGLHQRPNVTDVGGDSVANHRSPPSAAQRSGAERPACRRLLQAPQLMPVRSSALLGGGYLPPGSPTAFGKAGSM